MNVLLVNPESSFVLKNFSMIGLPDMPINLAYLVAILEGDGHAVRILDLNVTRSKEDLFNVLGQSIYQVIGFTSTTPVFTRCCKAIRVFKKKYPDATIVLGGWHASALPERSLQECPDIDFIVKGEGERTISELVAAIAQGSSTLDIPGIAFRDKDGGIIVNEDRALVTDLDALPYPARHLLPLEAYRRIGFTTVGGYFKRDLYLSSIVTSRGCSGKCTFCADRVINKGRCRLRLAEEVVKEIEHAIRTFNIRIFFFIDANFTASPRRVKKICNLIIEKQLRIMWGCAARVDSIDVELISLMKQAGCVRISLGIESGSPRVLKLMDKRISIRQIKDAVHATKKAKLPVYLYFVYGMPGETIDDAFMSRQLLMELAPDFMTQTIATPFPGSVLYERAREQGLLVGKGWERYNYPFDHVLELPDISRIIRLQSRFLLFFYSRPSFILSTFKNMKSIYHLLFYLKAFIAFCSYVLLYR